MESSGSSSSYRRHVVLLMMLPLVMIFEFSSWASPVYNSKLPESAAPNACKFSEADCAALNSLKLDGYLSFSDTSLAAQDYGGIISLPPAAVLYPRSVADIAAVVRAVYLSKSNNITVAAKGPGHSVNGQGQALNGIVVEMSTLRGIRVNAVDQYVDAAGGELWVNVLEASLEESLSPRSFTDYLYLSVGGTLSNAGISGQSFRHGPQISNVLQLEVVTGTGEIKVCSPRKNSDLYFAVLGGLGQFGIITRARIILKSAPQKVRWIRALYSDFKAFTRDQMYLISRKNNESSFDYVEGFVVQNSLSQTGWKSTHFQSESVVNTSLIPPSSASPVLYYIELTKNYDDRESRESVDKKVMELLAPLSYMPSFLFSSDVTYYDFLDRVRKTEMSLRSQGEWDVPHPWINVMIPQSKIQEFDSYVFRELLRTGITGPVLCYPHNRNKWDSRTSAVVPQQEEMFYVVALLQSALPHSGPSLGALMKRNQMILDYCEPLGCKQYLPNYRKLSDWERHFGDRWTKFLTNKVRFDPQAILSPGQNIFPRGGLIPRPATVGRQRV